MMMHCTITPAQMADAAAEIERVRLEMGLSPRDMAFVMNLDRRAYVRRATRSFRDQPSGPMARRFSWARAKMTGRAVKTERRRGAQDG